MNATKANKIDAKMIIIMRSAVILTIFVGLGIRGWLVSCCENSTRFFFGEGELFMLVH